MDSLVTLLATRTAATTLGLGRQTIAAAAKPFNAVLDAAMGASQATSDGESPEGDAQRVGDLEQLVAKRLQELLESLGMAAGERVELEIDQTTGEMRVAGNHPQATDLEEALRQDPQLGENLRLLAAETALFRDRFSTRPELTVEVGQAGDGALLAWSPFG